METGGGGGRLAIVAGNGFLPLHVAAAARRAGEDPYIIELKGESAERFPDFDCGSVGLGDIAGLVRQLKRAKATRVVLSGGVRRRPALKEIRPTAYMVRHFVSLLRNLIGGGDDAVLKMVIRLIEHEGPVVIGAHEVAPDLLLSHGPAGQHSPDHAARRDIQRAAEAAISLGVMDIGQAVVSVGARVVALEGPEGTDRMLQRVADLRREGRITARRKGVLVKMCKPQQDVRADLPSIGPSTVANAKTAGLAGIAIEAGRALILDREATIAAADAAGLFICGLDRTGDGSWA